MINICELEKSYYFCFLDMHYISTAAFDDLYELSLTSRHFDKTASVFVNKDKLKEFAESKLITDFRICDGYLQCNPHLPELTINSVIKECENEVLEDFTTGSTFYDLLQKGVENNFILIDNKLDELDNVIEWRITNFNRIQFSQSTMSIYAQIVSQQNEIKNKMIVTRDAGTLVMHPFLFAVPIDVDFDLAGCHFIKNQEIRGSMYRIYQAVDLAIFSKLSLVSKSTINKAMTLRTRYNAIIKILQDFKKDVWHRLNEEPTKEFTWVGGTSSYSSEYGVIFKSSIKVPSADDREEFLEFIQRERIKNRTSHSDFLLKMKERGITGILENAGKIISIILEQCENIDHALILLSSTINSLYDDLLYCDLYLFKIRSSLYLGRQRITTASNPFLFGGDETAYTIVKEGFFYELDGHNS